MECGKYSSEKVSVHNQTLPLIELQEARKKDVTVMWEQETRQRTSHSQEWKSLIGTANDQYPSVIPTSTTQQSIQTA